MRVRAAAGFIREVKSPRPVLSALSLVLLFGLVGCATSVSHLKLYESPPSSTVEPGTVHVQYLGVGGYLIRYGEEHLLLAPSFTNPAVLGQPPIAGYLRTDTKKVDRFLPDVSRVETILVGHAHYDHLLDVPYVMTRHAKRARVYGSRTMKHTLAAAVPGWRVVDVEGDMAQGEQPGRWYESPSKRLRFMALRSEHAPHFASRAFMSGYLTEDRTRLPSSAWGWLEGQTLAYLVDFLDEQGRPVFRLLYQDSAGNPSLGFLPALQMEDGKAVDVAILCVASHDNVEEYPQRLLGRVKPRHLILGHWEDFFGNDPSHPEGVRLTDIDGFLEKVKASANGAAWYLPKPLAEMRFSVEASADAAVGAVEP